jgi:GAF domain-containing protein
VSEVEIMWAEAPLSDGLRTLVGAAEQILAVDCVGVLLVDEDEQLRSVASSRPVVEVLEQAQQQLGVGPGVDSVRTSTTVAVDDLSGHEQYRSLATAVASSGVRAVLSAPVWVHEWTDSDIKAAESYADVVATMLQLTAKAQNANVSRDDGSGTVH